MAQFFCQIRHAVPPATIEWEKDGMSLSSDGRVLILDHGVLQISDIKNSDEGNYSCIARNVARVRYSQAASLLVKTGWYSTGTSNGWLVGVPRKSTPILQCNVGGSLSFIFCKA